MSDDLVKRLRMVTGFIRFETGDSACLSEEAADRIEELEAEIKLHEECATTVHFQGVRYAHENMANTIWAEFKDKWDGEKKFALREVVKYLREKDDVGTVVDTDVSGGS